MGWGEREDGCTYICMLGGWGSLLASGLLSPEGLGGEEDSQWC